MTKAWPQKQKCCSEVEVERVAGIQNIFKVPRRQCGQGHKQRLENTDLIPAGPPERRTPKQKLDVMQQLHLPLEAEP